MSELTSLSETTAIAESMLQTWFQRMSQVNNSIDELNFGIQALWRLTAIRKTLCTLEDLHAARTKAGDAQQENEAKPTDPPNKPGDPPPRAHRKPRT